MTLITRLIGARQAVEVGTFTGYSALSIARGLPDDGHLLCCDVSEEWTAIGRRAWAERGRRRQDRAADRARRRHAARAARRGVRRPRVHRRRQARVPRVLRGAAAAAATQRADHGRQHALGRRHRRRRPSTTSRPSRCARSTTWSRPTTASTPRCSPSATASRCCASADGQTADSELPGAPVAVVAGELLVRSPSGRGTISPRRCAPHTISAVRSTSPAMCSTSAGLLPTTNSPWLAMSTALAVADAAGDLVGELDRCRWSRTSATGTSPPDVHHELLDHRGDRLAGQREHRAVLGVAVHGRVDLGIAAQRARGAASSRWSGSRWPSTTSPSRSHTTRSSSVHLQVVERRRREHHVAVGQARGDVAGGALHQSRREHLLRDRRAVAPSPRRGRRGLRHSLSTSGFTRLSGLPPSSSVSEAVDDQRACGWSRCRRSRRRCAA